MQDRPRNLTYLAVASVIASVVWLAAGMALVFGGTLAGALGESNGGAAVVVGALLFVLSAAGLLLGFGFWMRRPWAWTAGVVVLSTGIVLSFATLLLGASIPSVILPVAVSGGILWYLWQPQVRSLLRPSD